MTLHKAKWWQALEGNAVQCRLCPRQCRIQPGCTGYCAARENCDGTLYSLSYGHPVSVAIDPIEKKPLAHFMPGTKTLSFGAFGCNLGCIFCQNYSLSRQSYTPDTLYRDISPAQIVKLTQQHKCPSLSFTYNEPSTFAEYAIDIAQLAHKAGIKTVLVSNGYISPEAADELYPLIDAANIDMKGFSQDFYSQMCQATLQPVLDSLEKLYALGVHLEITTLVIPGKNDDDASTLAWLDWVEAHLDKSVPLHFNAYYPAYKCNIPCTPPETLYHLRSLAQKRGFLNVHLGNI